MVIKIIKSRYVLACLYCSSAVSREPPPPIIPSLIPSNYSYHDYHCVILTFLPYLTLPYLVQHSPQASTTTSLEAINVGIVGGGTVGGGICEILTNKADYLTTLCSNEIHVKSICVRDLSKQRDFDIPPGCTITDDIDSIVNSDDIDIVVEVMGGTTLAKDVVFNALSNGKHVVTANKALIAAALGDIESHVLAINKDKPSQDLIQFNYEAAVCGGIPIINSLQSDYPGDQIHMIAGIINGCTNFMLSGMDRDGLTYDEALSQASKLGYAEADPTLDVGGFDARSKLKILIRLAYGLDVDEANISCRGIQELTATDYDYAKSLGGTIKLLGVAERVGDKVSGFVSPCYVSGSDSLSSVSDATNAVEISSKNLDRTTYIGQGAGRYPTANSCVNDIAAIAKGDRLASPFNPSSECKFVQRYDSVFYLRLKYKDKIGITRQCGEICEKYGVSIHSLLQNPRSGKSNDSFVIVTEKVSNTDMKKVVAELEDLEWVQGPAFWMPVLRPDWM
jgi:homoserine dehydrogenase